MNKKAQAGLEFLATYGWAMLGIVLIAGTIAYFTIDLEKTAPNQCELGNIKCGSFIVSEQRDFSGAMEINNTQYRGIFGRIEFDFNNPESDVINISGVIFEFENQEILSSCDSLSILVNPGRITEIRCTLCKEMSDGLCESFLGGQNKDKINVDIKYKIQDKAFDKHGQGEIIFGVTNVELEIPECYDGEDNDDDSKTDYPNDFACKCGLGEDETETCEFRANCLSKGNDCRSDLYLTCEDAMIDTCKGNIKYVCGKNNTDCTKTPLLSCINTICTPIGELNDICDPDDHEDCDGTNLICESKKCKGNLTYTSCLNNNTNCVDQFTCISNVCETKGILNESCDSGDNEDCNSPQLLICDNSLNNCLGNISAKCHYDYDCANNFVCDVNGDCRINISEPCNSHDECIEGAACQNNICIDTPDWCSNINITNDFYWNETLGECWIADVNAKISCDELCGTNLLSCNSTIDWNDNSNCEMLNTFFNCKGTCYEEKLNLAPAYINEQCAYRNINYHQQCNSRSKTANRICLCNQ